MQCPPEIAVIVGDILQMGLLRIRMLDDLARCRLEADHLHNLPALLVDYQPQLLDYYWNVERPCFTERSTPEEIGVFEPLWRALAPLVAAEKIGVATR